MGFAAATLCFLLATGASGAPSHARVAWKPLPAHAEHATMNAGDYYLVLVIGEYGKVERVVARVRTQITNGDVDDMDLSYSALQQTLITAISRLDEFPAWKDETTLRDAITAAYVTWHAIAQRERDEAFEFTIRTPHNDRDMREFEKIRKELDREWEKSNAIIRKVVTDFAAGERLVFKPTGGDAEVDPFEAVGLPPPGSKLSAAIWVSRAIAYHNALYADTQTMVEAMNKVSEKMTSSELQGARKSALEAIVPVVDDAMTYGAIGGDQRYRDAIVSYGQWMIDQLEGPIKEAADLTEDGSIKREEIARLNAIADGLNNGAAAKAAWVDDTRQTFLGRWHAEAYLDWRKTQKKR